MKTELALSLVIAGALSLFGGPARADLLNVILSTPITFFNGNGQTTFNAGTGELKITGSVINTDFGSGPLAGSGSVTIDIFLNSSGGVAGGAAGNDFEMTGTVTNGSTTFTGLLLKGE